MSLHTEIVMYGVDSFRVVRLCTPYMYRDEVPSTTGSAPAWGRIIALVASKDKHSITAQRMDQQEARRSG